MLFFNLDCTDFAYHHDTAHDGGGQIDGYIDRIMDGGATHLLCNTQAARTNYASDAWEPMWAGLDPDGPDDQPFLAAIGDPALAARWRRLVTSMLNLHRQGIDYPARVLARCRARGGAGWITLRMNDVHSQDNAAHPIHSSFWRDNPQLRRKGYSGYYAKAFDYAHAAVREYYRSLVVETLGRYDVDGLELDFMREPYLFSRGQEDVGRGILTAWLGEIRELVEATAERRGHPVQLGVRVPSRPAVCERFGLAAADWAKEGLIDVVVPTPRWASTEFDLPIADWVVLVEGTGVALLGGQEILYRPSRNAAARGVTPEQARGVAAHALGSGANGVYLFNYFPSGQPSGGSWWSTEAYPQVLQSLTCLDRVLQCSRSHAITGHDVCSPDGSEDAGDQLPATGERVVLALPTGPRPKGAWAATLAVDLEVRDDDVAVPAIVSVNGSTTLVRRAESGTERAGEGSPALAGDAHYEYDLPVDVLADREPNRLEMWRGDGGALVVLAVQVHLSRG